MKFKVPWSLLSESVVKCFTPFYHFFTKMAIRNVLLQNLNSFLRAVLEKFVINLNNTSLYMELVIKLVSKQTSSQVS